MERTGLVTVRGNPLTLVGAAIDIGDMAPDFRAVKNGFQPVRLSELGARVVVISAVPSLDTPVCSLQTLQFERRALELGDKVSFLTISADLPFAQNRFCKEKDVARMLVVSDATYGEFGRRFGVRIKDRGILARSVWVIDAAGRIVHREIVPDLTREPDYEAALKAVRSALR